MLKPTGSKRLKLKYDILLSTSAFKLSLRRYILGVKNSINRSAGGAGDGFEMMAGGHGGASQVGRCRLTLWYPG